MSARRRGLGRCTALPAALVEATWAPAAACALTAACCACTHSLFRERLAEEGKQLREELDK